MSLRLDPPSVLDLFSRIALFLPCNRRVRSSITRHFLWLSSSHAHNVRVFFLCQIIMHALWVRKLRHATVSPEEKIALCYRLLKCSPLLVAKTSAVTDHVLYVLLQPNHTDVPATVLAQYWTLFQTVAKNNPLRPEECVQIAQVAGDHILRSSSLAAQVFHSLLGLSWVDSFLSLSLLAIAKLISATLHQTGNGNRTMAIKNSRCFLRRLVLSYARIQDASGHDSEVIRVFLTHLLEPFSNAAPGERKLGKLLLGQVLTVWAQPEHFNTSMEKHLDVLAKNSDFVVEAFLETVSSTKEGRSSDLVPLKFLKLRSGTDERASAGRLLNVILITLNSCLEKANSKDLKLVFHSIEKLFSRARLSKLLSFTNLRASKNESRRSSEKESVSDRAEINRLFSALCDAPQRLAHGPHSVELITSVLRAISSMLTAAGHSIEGSKKVVKMLEMEEIIKSIDVVELESVVCSLFTSYASSWNLSMLFRILASSLSSDFGKFAVVLTGEKVLSKIGSAIRTLPRTHASLCLDEMRHPDSSAHPVIFILVAVIVESVPANDRQEVVRKSLNFLSTYPAASSVFPERRSAELYLLSTLLVTNLRSSNMGDHVQMQETLLHAALLSLTGKDHGTLRLRDSLLLMVEHLSSFGNAGGALQKVCATRFLCILVHVAVRQNNMDDVAMVGGVASSNMYVLVTDNTKCPLTTPWPALNVEAVSGAAMGVHDILEELGCEESDLMKRVADISRTVISQAGHPLELMESCNAQDAFQTEGHRRLEKHLLSGSSSVHRRYDDAFVINALRTFVNNPGSIGDWKTAYHYIKQTWILKHRSPEIYLELTSLARCSLFRASGSSATDGEKFCKKTAKRLLEQLKLPLQGDSSSISGEKFLGHVAEVLLLYLTCHSELQTSTTKIAISTIFDRIDVWISENVSVILKTIVQYLQEGHMLDIWQEKGGYSALVCLCISMSDCSLLTLLNAKDRGKILVSLLNSLLGIVGHRNPEVVYIGWDMLAVMAQASSQSRRVVGELFSLITRVSRRSPMMDEWKESDNFNVFNEELSQLFLGNRNDISERRHGFRKNTFWSNDSFPKSFLRVGRDLAIYSQAMFERKDSEQRGFAQSNGLLYASAVSRRLGRGSNFRPAGIEADAQAVYSWTNAIQAQHRNSDIDNDINVDTSRLSDYLQHAGRRTVSWTQLRIWRQMMSKSKPGSHLDLKVFLGSLRDAHPDFNLGFAADITSSEHGDRTAASLFQAQHVEDLKSLHEELRMYSENAQRNIFTVPEPGIAYIGK